MNDIHKIIEEVNNLYPDSPCENDKQLIFRLGLELHQERLKASFWKQEYENLLKEKHE